MQDQAEKKKDIIAELCSILKEAGATLTLYGKPIEERALRQYAESSAKKRILDAFDLEPRFQMRLGYGIATHRNVAEERASFLAAMELS